MSAYVPLGTHKAVILRYCYTCTQLHVHTHVCMGDRERARVSMKCWLHVKILRQSLLTHVAY